MDWDPFAAEDAAVLRLEVSRPHGMSSVADSFEESMNDRANLCCLKSVQPLYDSF